MKMFVDIQPVETDHAVDRKWSTPNIMKIWDNKLATLSLALCCQQSAISVANFQTAYQY